MQDMAKLPRWAQHRIEQLESSVEWWQKKCQILEGEADIEASPHMEPRALAGSDETIRFWLERPDHYVDIEIKERGGERFVEVHARHDLYVRAISGNMVYIYDRTYQ